MLAWLAPEPLRSRIGRSGRGPAISVGLHLLLVMYFWLPSSLIQVPLKSFPRGGVLLAPPPDGTPGSQQPHSRFGSPMAAGSGTIPIDVDHVEVRIEDDMRRDLIPVLKGHRGLIVCVKPENRLVAVAAFQAPNWAAVPAGFSLNQFFRVRIGNPTWWSEAGHLCQATDHADQMLVFAAFPPEFRHHLSHAVQSYMVQHRLSINTVRRIRLAFRADLQGGVEITDVEGDGHRKSELTGRVQEGLGPYGSL